MYKRQVLETPQMKAIATIKVGALPYAATLALNDSRLFVTNMDDGTVSVIDTESLTTIGLIEVGEKPEGIGTHLDDRHIYVANWFDKNVSLLDAKTLQAKEKITTARGSRAFGQFIGK